MPNDKLEMFDDYHKSIDEFYENVLRKNALGGQTMAIEYLGLSEINGPLVVLEGVTGASYDEIVEITVWRTETKSWVVS